MGEGLPAKIIEDWKNKHRQELVMYVNTPINLLPLIGI